MRIRPELFSLSRARTFILVVIAFLLADQFNLQQFSLFNPRSLGSLSEEQQETEGKAEVRVVSHQRKEHFSVAKPPAARMPHYSHAPRLEPIFSLEVKSDYSLVHLSAQLRC